MEEKQNSTVCTLVIPPSYCLHRQAPTHNERSRLRPSISLIHLVFSLFFPPQLCISFIFFVINAFIGEGWKFLSCPSSSFFFSLLSHSFHSFPGQAITGSLIMSTRAERQG